MTGSWDAVPVLVTGATGLIGSWLVERLIAEGSTVVAPVRGRALDAGHDPRLELTEIDILDDKSVERVMNEHEIQFVFHLAAKTIAEDALERPHEAFDVNVRGTYNVLEAARRTRGAGLDVRVIVASTSHVYGPDAEAPFREDHALRARAPHNASKVCADLLARSYAATYDMPVAVTRLANVYGGGDRHESRIVPAAARALVAGEAPVIRSDGTAERDFIYAEDAAAAYLKVAESLESSELWGRAWNFGADRPVAVVDLIRRLIAVSGRDVEPVILEQAAPGTTVDRHYVDSSAIRRELNCEPRWQLDDGLAATYAWYEGQAA